MSKLIAGKLTKEITRGTRRFWVSNVARAISRVCVYVYDTPSTLKFYTFPLGLVCRCIPDWPIRPGTTIR